MQTERLLFSLNGRVEIQTVEEVHLKKLSETMKKGAIHEHFVLMEMHGVDAEKKVN